MSFQFEIRELTFSYPGAERPQLDGVSLNIERGSYTVVCGRSGSGKTTLLRHLKTVLTPYGEAQQVGRICMDMCMIDVTDLPQLKVGDEIEVFGEHQLIETAAKQCGTISYELLCAVSKRVPRYYYLGGKCVDRNLQLLG